MTISVQIFGRDWHIPDAFWHVLTRFDHNYFCAISFRSIWLRYIYDLVIPSEAKDDNAAIGIHGTEKKLSWKRKVKKFRGGGK